MRLPKHSSAQCPKTLHSLDRHQILNDLQNLYHAAVSQDNLSIALKAKELQGKILGVFHNAVPPSFDLKALTDEQIQEWIEKINLSSSS